MVEKSPTRINRSRDYSPLDNPPTGGFCPKHSFSHLYYPYKRDRLATTVRPCSLRQNRRATGARIWGLYKLKPFRRKCYFLYSQTVNRTNFFAQLAYGKMTFSNVSFLFGWCKVKNTANVSSVQSKNTAFISPVQSEIFTLFRCCKGVSLSKVIFSTQFS